MQNNFFIHGILILRSKFFDIIFSIIFLFFRKKIFFGKINKKGKISHLICYVEPVARKKIVKENILVIINPGKNANDFLVKHYKKKYIYISYKDKYYAFVNYFFLFFIKEGKYDLKFQDFRDTESTKIWSNSKPSIILDKNEEILGDEILNEMKLKKKNYICFGLRDPEFYKDRSSSIEIDASENSFHRNPNPKNYEKFINYFCNLGINVCRVGSKVSYNFENINNDKFFDYSNSKFRSDFMDIYLQKNAKFVLSGGAGLWTIANLFNVPVVLTDNYMLFGSKRYSDLFLPKLLFNKEKNNFLKFEEMIQVGQKYLFEENCYKDNIFFKNSEEDEILSVAIEMNSKIDNTFSENLEIKNLKKQFENLLPVKRSKYFHENEFFYQKNMRFAASISSDFLVKYKYLL